MASHRLAKIPLKYFDVAGYSVAGEESVVAVPQLDCCFDIGKAPDQFISINHVLLSHGHMDHAAGIAYYLSHRKFDGQAPGTVLAPKNLVSPLEQIIEGWGRLDGNQIPVNLIGVEPGDEYAIKPNLFARAFSTPHCHGSLGFTLLEKRKKLKPEFRRLTGPQIVDLKKQGIAIEIHLDLPLVTYLGDTGPMTFENLEYVANSKVLITECTFYEDDHKDRAEAGNHMHISDFVRQLDRLNNEHIIITHATQRTNPTQTKRILTKAIPQAWQDKIHLLMDRQYLRRSSVQKVEDRS
jgi:ribonuclease Z